MNIKHYYYIECICFLVPPNITYISPDVEIIAGGSAIFECVFEAVPDPLVVWRFNDVLLADIGSDKYSFDHGNYTLTVHDVQVYDAGEYTCTVSNMYGNDTEIFNLYVQGNLIDICVDK